jgi:hypothetical protein
VKRWGIEEGMGRGKGTVSCKEREGGAGGGSGQYHRDREPPVLVFLSWLQVFFAFFEIFVKIHRGVPTLIRSSGLIEPYKTICR